MKRNMKMYSRPEGNPSEGVGSPNTFITPARNRILSFALALAVLLGITVYQPFAAHAVDMGTAADLTLDVQRTDRGVPVGSRVYFGWDDNGDPILWRVVAMDSGTLTLFCDGDVGERPYNPSLSHNFWSGSEICHWLNGTSGGSYDFTVDGFLPTAFTARERAAMVAQYSTASENDSITPNQTIVLPSKTDVDINNWNVGWQMSQSDRAYRDDWWLRSLGGDSFLALSCSFDGSHTMDDTVYSDRPIRPAYKLNLASVIFTSDASGANAKSDATVGSTLLSVPQAPTVDVKLTILDNGMAMPTLTFAGTTTGTNELRFGYTGAATGTDQYISCVLEQGGTVTHYGKLADCETNGNGVFAIDTSTLAAGPYDLKIFCEQVGGAYQTDYAGPSVNLTLEVDGSVTGANTDNTRPAVQSVVPADGAVDVSTSGTFAITFDKAMHTTGAGTVSLTGGSGTVDAAGTWSNSNTTYTVNYSSLDSNTAYGIGIADFQDAAGNEMVAVTSGYGFTTANAPITGAGPSVSTNNLTVTVGETADFTVNLGDGANAATSASISSSDTTIATATPTNLPLGQSGTVTVKGEKVGQATITIGYSGGSRNNEEDEVRVTVTNQPITQVRVDFDTQGGTPPPNPIDVVVGGTYPALPTVTRGSDTFEGWYTAASGGIEVTQGDTVTNSSDHTLYAQWSGDGGGGTAPPTTPSASGSTRSSGGSSGGSTYTPQLKTTLPASAFRWDGRTLAINHDSVTPLGLLSVRWDGATLTRGTDYGVYQGSVIVRFGEDFMAAQAPGDHTVRVEFLNHTGEATVTVDGEPAQTAEPNDDLFTGDTHNPNTGGYPDGGMGTTDNPNTGDGRRIWPALLLGGMGAAALVFFPLQEQQTKMYKEGLK